MGTKQKPKVKTYKTSTGTKIKVGSDGSKGFTTTQNIPGGNKTTSHNYMPPRK